MTFDWTITLGNLLTVAGFLGGGIFFMIAIRRDVDILSTRLAPLEKAVLKLTDILVQLGRQSERLNALERDIERYDAREEWRQSKAREPSGR